MSVHSRSLVLIVHNVRSTHNVGSILRTADGFGVDRVILSGYTPYPAMESDERLPHLAAKIDRQIHKTALGAEKSVNWQRREDISAVIRQLKANGYWVAALEQAFGSVALDSFKKPAKIALIVGAEVDGVNKEILDQADDIIEIPMKGAKESFNVAVAAGIALYALSVSS